MRNKSEEAFLTLEIDKFLKAGLKRHEVRKMLNVPFKLIKVRADLLGIKFKPGPELLPKGKFRNAEAAAKIVSLRDSGLGIKEVAFHFPNWSTQRVAYYWRKA